jgi:DNA segregation ATPase FtsK/SpoIIIE, S-DNA-T family
MEARIRFTDGPLSGQTFDVAGERIVIGRGPDCDIVVDSPMVQRQNCVLLKDEFTLRIRDLGSLRGTFVNGRCIRPGNGEMVVLHHDLITVGGTNFIVEIDAPMMAQAR